MALEIERKFLVLDDSYKHEAFSKSHIWQGYICSERGRTVRVRIRDEHGYITIKGPSVDGGLARSEFEYEVPLDDAKQLMMLCEPGQIDKIRWLVKSGDHTFEVDEFFGDNEAFLTIKGPSLDGGLSRYEFEQSIPIDDAEKLMTLCDEGIIDKTRWLVKSGDHTFEVDEFHGDNDGLVMAEVELKNVQDTPKMPHFIGKEVTGDRRYYNSQLRRNPYKLWREA